MVIYKVEYGGKSRFVTAAGYQRDPDRNTATFYEDAEGNHAKAFFNYVESIESFGSAPDGAAALPVVWVANKPEGEVLQPTESVPGAGVYQKEEAAGDGANGGGEGN